MLREIAVYVGGNFGSVTWKDVSRQSAELHDLGVREDYVQSDSGTCVTLDPSTTGLGLAEVGQIVSTFDVLAYEEFVDTRFYQEWARPPALAGSAVALRDRSAAGATPVGVFTTAKRGRVDDDMRRRMQLLLPHIRRAAVIGLRSGEADLSVVLDGLSAAVF